MPDTKITALTAIGVVDASLDPLPIVDTSDTSMAATGTTKKISINQILGAGGAGSFSTLAASGAATLSSTLGVTGATTLTGALTANGNVTLGDALADVVTVNGSLTARNGELASSIRAAASDYAGVAFDGATSSSRVTSTLTGQNVGTSDFSVWCRARVLANSQGTLIGLGPTSSNPFGADSFIVYVGTSTLIVAKRSSADAFQAVFQLNDFASTYAGQVVDVVVTRGGGIYSIYINGSLQSTSSSFATENVSSSYLHVGAQTNLPWNSTIYRAVLFNRALSATDVADLIELGVDPADQWGTQTNIVGAGVNNGDFTAFTGSSPNNWTAVGYTTADLSPGLRLTAGASYANSYSSQLSSAGSTFAAKRYRVSVTARQQTGPGELGTSLSGLSAASDTVNYALTSSFQTFVHEVIATISSSLKLRIVGGTASVSAIDISNVTVTRIGAIVDLDFTVGAGLQSTDRSTNNLHGTLFGGVEFTMPKRMAVLYATTNTNGNQQMLGTLAIPTNAIIEDIVVNSTGTATVSVGNASAGTQIVNGASVVSGRQKLTLATPFSTTGNLWVNSNSTATLQFTIFYTIAS